MDSECVAASGRGDSVPVQESVSAGPEITVRVASTIEEIEAIREVWSSWNTDRDSDVDYCRQFVWSTQRFIRPHVVVICRQGCPDAIFVGRLDRARIDAKIGYLRLPGMRTRCLTFASGGFLGNCSPENCQEFVKSVLHTLKRKEADAALLQQVNKESPLFQTALALPGVASRDFMPKLADHYYLRLPRTVEQFYLGLSSRHRKHLRSEAKKLMADFDGQFAVRCFPHEGSLDDIIPDVEEIAKKSYQRGLRVGFEDTPEVRKWLRILVQKGWLHIYVLYLNDCPGAFSIGSICGGKYSCDFLGYDPRFAEYSPGSFLMTKMIEDFCKSGVREVDFGFGNAMYKKRFGNHQEVEASFYLYSPSVKGAALNLMRAGAAVIDGALRKLVDGTTLLPRIKKIWRSKLTSQIAQSDTGPISERK